MFGGGKKVPHLVAKEKRICYNLKGLCLMAEKYGNGFIRIGNGLIHLFFTDIAESKFDGG